MENQKQFKIDAGQIECKNDTKVLPNLVLEIILRKLTVTERLRMERVDRFWNGAVWEHGWKGQKKLDFEVVFRGAQRVNRDAFTDESLIALFSRMKGNLIELDVRSFNQAIRFFNRPKTGSLFDGKMRITSGICPSLSLLTNLSKINLDEIDLTGAVPFLPETLSELYSVSSSITKKTLSALSNKCPYLEAIDFGSGYDEIAVSSMNKFLRKYPGLKKLRLGFIFLKGPVKLTSLGELEELEEFEVNGGSFHKEAFEAIVNNCKCLRRLTIVNTEFPTPVKPFHALAELPNLVELVLQPKIIDSVVKSIAKCQKLEKLEINGRKKIKEESIVYLVKHCKSLDSLVVDKCRRISGNSLLPFKEDSHYDRRTTYVCEVLLHLPDFSKIDIEYFDLSEIVSVLPKALREIRSSGPFNAETLSALAAKCPHLEAIDFIYGEVKTTTVSCMNDFLLNYPRLKKLRLNCSFVDDGDTLSSIGELKELEEFELSNNNWPFVPFIASYFDGVAFEAMIDGCKRLRRLVIDDWILVFEESFCLLAKLPNLVELVLPSGHSSINDSVVKTIATHCRDLKKLQIALFNKITDESVACLLENCKSLVTLDVCRCPLITEKSLEAVVAEVIRRHGEPPRTLPKGPADEGIFYFRCKKTAIDWKKALIATANNPWLKLKFDKRLEARTF